MGPRSARALALAATLLLPAPIAGAAAPLLDVAGPLVGGVAPAASASATLRLGLEAFVGAPTRSSRTRVREGTSLGTRLRLSRDLGIDVMGELGLTLGVRLDEDDALVASFSHVFLYGGASPPVAVTYNATTYLAGARLDSSPSYFVLALRYERALVRFGLHGRGVLALEVGARLDVLGWHLQGTRDPTSSGKEQGEGFARQATPIPMPGLSLRVPVSAGLDLTACARGFRANHWSTGRVEGGIVYLSETALEVGLGLAYRVSPALEVVLSYRYLQVDLREESHEDGNVLVLEAHGAAFGVAWSF